MLFEILRCSCAPLRWPTPPGGLVEKEADVNKKKLLMSRVIVHILGVIISEHIVLHFWEILKDPIKVVAPSMWSHYFSRENPSFWLTTLEQLKTPNLLAKKTGDQLLSHAQSHFDPNQREIRKLGTYPTTERKVVKRCWCSRKTLLFLFWILFSSAAHENWPETLDRPVHFSKPRNYTPRSHTERTANGSRLSKHTLK